MSTREEIEDLHNALIGDNWPLFQRSASFHAWVQLQAQTLLTQRDILVQAFHAQLADDDRRYIEALTDTRPRLISGGKIWVQEAKGFPILEEDYIVGGADANG